MSPDDLSQRECCGILDQLAEYAPIRLVLSGGEPLWRRDVFDLAQRATDKGLNVALETNGTLIDETMAERIHAAGFQRVAVGLDGADRVTHNTFRGHAGAFEATVRGLKYMQALGLSTQINTVISNHNAHQLPEIVNLAESLGVHAIHVFVQVPVGCGLTVSQDQTLGSADAERISNWINERSLTTKMELKAIARDHPFGADVCFVSHRGEVFLSAKAPVVIGDLRKQKFKEIWDNTDQRHV